MEKRQIKFRFWSEEDKEMYFADLYEAMINGVEDFSEDWPVMQFTGLKDKYDKEIYEGDIGEMQMINEFGSSEIKRGVMEMHPDGYWAFKSESEYDLEKTSPPKVIGNIYEHPNLLP